MSVKASAAATRETHVSRMFAALMFVAIFAIGIFATSFWPIQPRSYSKPELSLAVRYVDELPSRTPIPVFVSDQPVSRVYGASSEEIVSELKRLRPGRYRKAWGDSEIAIIVSSGILRKRGEERRAVLEALSIQEWIIADVSTQEVIDGCLARRVLSNGWMHSGYVLADPEMLATTGTSVAECAIAGFDYLDGFPIDGARFALATMSVPRVRAAVLDYVKTCSRAGEVDLGGSRARTGYATNPSLNCIRRHLVKALAEAP